MDFRKSCYQWLVNNHCSFVAGQQLLFISCCSTTAQVQLLLNGSRLTDLTALIPELKAELGICVEAM
jgi:hypothetical protein